MHHLNKNKIIPTVGDYIEYKGILSEVIEIDHFAGALSIKHLEKEIILTLKKNYMVYDADSESKKGPANGENAGA